MAQRPMTVSVALVGIALVVGSLAAPAAAWEPTKPVEFVVPAGTGGGADQMARLIAPLVDKYKLSPRPLVVVNKAGGAGAEGFTYVKAKSGDAHTIIITLSNLFTTPLHTGVPFNWKDLTPVARLALDEFILWVNTDRPDKKEFKTAKDYIAAAKAASGGDGKMKMGGTGTAQEDQIITVLLEQALGVKFIYVPFKGGGEVCVNLVGNHVDSTVNNPIECAGHLEGRPRAAARRVRHEAPDRHRVGRHSHGQGGARRGHQLPDAAGDLRRPRHAGGGGRVLPGHAPEGLRDSGVQGVPGAGCVEPRVADRPRLRQVAGGAQKCSTRTS